MTTIPEQAVTEAAKRSYEYEGDRRGICYIGWDNEPSKVREDWMNSVRTVLTAALPFIRGVGVKEAIEEAYFLGFSGSAEGYNAEYPFEGVGYTKDDEWIKHRDTALSRILSTLDLSPGTSRQQLIQEKSTLADQSKNEPGAMGERERALDALKAAEQFIENGFELGFIRKPDEGDTALETLPKIKAAIRALTHTDAGKVEGSAAARDVLAERKRQIEVEGWDHYHDDANERAELAQAAACYALSGTPADEAVFIHGRWNDPRDLFWPYSWSREWWKPTNRRRDLVKAGALILAEIERLDRLSAPSQEVA